MLPSPLQDLDSAMLRLSILMETPSTSTFVSGSQLSAAIPASSEMVSGTHAITVSNPTPGGGNSTSASFSVSNLAPSLASVIPSTISVGAPTTQIELDGSNFLPTSTVSLNSASISSTYVSANQVIATVPSGSLSAAGNLSIGIANPTPGGGASNSFTLTVTNQTSASSEIGPKDASGGISSSSFSYIIGSSNAILNSEPQDSVTTQLRGSFASPGA